MKIMHIGRDRKSKKEIMEKAFESYSFDYVSSKLKNDNEKNDSEKQESFSEAVNRIPNLEINIQEVDYYA